MIRTIAMLGFWVLALVFAALIAIPWSLIVGNINLLYKVAMWTAFHGVRIAGVRVVSEGLEQIDPRRTYVYMSNHVSNIDPPILIPVLPFRTSVMAKKELFKYPVFGRVLRMGSLVPVDRGNRDAGIAAVREATAVLRQGISMTIFVEGKRSWDGKLLPFKKGPFYLAMECDVPVVPITIVGTHYVMPKGRFSVKPGTVKLVFHRPIEQKDFGSREELMAKVWDIINSGLPPEYQQTPLSTTQPREDRKGSTKTA